MVLDKENKRVIDAKNKLREKFTRKEMADEQIDLKLISLDVDFLLHSFVNGYFQKKMTIKEKLEFYIKYLEMNLRT